MRVGIALLVDDAFANRMTQVSLRLREYGFGLRVLRLPPHVSLKQPFIVSDFSRFERYFDALAAQMQPVLLQFNGFTLWGNPDEAVVELSVIASKTLRDLHARLNTELEREFGDTRADFDGEAYEFHLTVGLGRFRAEMMPHLQADLAALPYPDHALTGKLVMFVYEQSDRPDALYGVREYGTYKVLSLV